MPFDFGSKHPRILVAFKIAAAIGLAVAVAVTWGLVRNRYPQLPNWSGDLLAILAIAFAVVQFLDARSQERELSQQANRLADITGSMSRQQQALGDQANRMQEIAASMSTRFVGPFPENLQEIVAMLQKANRTIDIIVDFPGYGQFSALPTYIEYMSALQRARTKPIGVRVICYKKNLVEKELLEQFPDGDPSKVLNGQLFDRYFDYLANLERPADCAGLRNVLVKQDQQTVISTSPFINWRFHGERAAFFLWLVDDSEAIFTFKNVGRKDVGLSFRTRDGKLVLQFTEIFKRRWDVADQSDELCRPFAIPAKPQGA